MAWFLGHHRRGPPWKHSWASRALSSASLPPPPLIAILFIVILLLSLSGYTGYKAQVRRTTVGFNLLLFVLPVILLLTAAYAFQNGRLAVRLPRAEQRTIHRAGSSPWGVAVVVVLLLVMVSYQSYFHSQWFHGLWGSRY